MESFNEDRWTLYDIYTEGLNYTKSQREIKSETRKNSGFDHASNFVINKTWVVKNFSLFRLIVSCMLSYLLISYLISS